MVPATSTLCIPARHWSSKCACRPAMQSEPSSSSGVPIAEMKRELVTIGLSLLLTMAFLGKLNVT
jgi:hypothetical protein